MASAVPFLVTLQSQVFIVIIGFLLRRTIATGHKSLVHSSTHRGCMIPVGDLLRGRLTARD